ncbi:MAG TPA: fused MFS/spermidine synthase, partial [Stellaceae bacterium]|nr:fused MFS/spermidine synthase [Stellaceae bacterium]
WNTNMCFFQAVLLGGYLYAHLLATHFERRTQALIHGVVLLAAAAFLPLDLTQATPPSDGIPVLWLIGRLAISVGPPFFAISATAPLLQRWFSRTDHPAAVDPYFLYAASNAGSLIALLSYPLLVEPNLALPAQSRAWSLGLALVAAGIGICWLGYRSHAAPEAVLQAPAASPEWAERLRWVAFAFVPSALLLAVTSHITTDLASAPLFWVIPLALYLLTFIFAFASRPPLPHTLMLRLQPFLIIPLVVVSAMLHSIWLLGLHLALFFVIAMVCHGELARRRPPAANLTEFYLCVSLGGVLGGIFDALVAPVIFPDIWEYPLLLALSCLARPPSVAGGTNARWADFYLPAVLLAGLAALIFAGNLPAWVLVAALPLAAVALLQFSQRRWRFALGVGVCLLVEQIAASGNTLATARSFFGVNRVRLVEDATLRVFQHGTTVHGAEYVDFGRETIPLGYYNREGPFGRFFAALAGRSVKQVGIVGLGAGDLACYAKPGQTWTFHEIDPAVERIARDPRHFHFLERCGNDPRVILGDARLTLHDVPDGHYDVLVIDAFSSDSIPLHLLTREALALYGRKLAPDGVLLFHISNRYLDLAPVLAALAKDAGMPARHMIDLAPPPESAARLSAEVVALGQPGHSIDFLTASAGWQQLIAPPRSVSWTDGRSDIISRIKWRGTAH